MAPDAGPGVGLHACLNLGRGPALVSRVVVVLEVLGVALVAGGALVNDHGRLFRVLNVDRRQEKALFFAFLDSVCLLV